MKPELLTVRLLCNRLTKTPPYNEANFRFLSGKGSAAYSNTSSQSIGLDKLDSYLCELGKSNIATLVAEGRTIKNLPKSEQTLVLNATGQLAWMKYEGCYVWETAAAVSPEELVRCLQVVKPLPNKQWTKAITGLLSRD